MDDNISLQVKRLIDLDQKAIELEAKREHELSELGQSYKDNKAGISLELQKAKEKARETYDGLVKQAKKEAETITADANQKLQAAEKQMDKEIENIATECWKKILNSIEQ